MEGIENLKNTATLCELGSLGGSTGYVSTAYIIYQGYVPCCYINEQKAGFEAEAVRWWSAGGETHPHARRAHAHTHAAPRPCVSSQSERANRPTADSTYSYYYERRNAFCRARTKFVALRLPIIKIVNAFQALKFVSALIDVALPTYKNYFFRVQVNITWP